MSHSIVFALDCFIILHDLMHVPHSYLCITVSRLPPPLFPSPPPPLPSLLPTTQASPSFIFDPSTAVVTQIRDGNYELKIEIPVTAPVGTHLVGIRLSDKGNVVALNRRLAVIFNPYHEGDNTYYPNHVEREEYLNNESGITYRGATRVCYTSMSCDVYLLLHDM